MASQGLLAELDHGALPGRRNLDPRFTGMRADPDGRWAIPYLGASTGIGYRKGAVEPPPRRWADLFDPGFLEKVKGRLSILDDAREAAAIALLAIGFSPNTTDPGVIAKAGDLLRRQKPAVACYDSEAFEDKLASGICSVVQGYAGDFVAVMKDDAELDFFIPDEGSVFNMDCLCVLRESPRKLPAHQFLEYILRPDVAARISQGTGYPTANAAAARIIPAALREHPCFRIPEGDRLIMLEDPGAAVKDLFTQAWESVKQA
jgi:spermidine/putrescine transport system substrate-binding protein